MNHPQIQLIEEYANGALNSPVSLLIRAHLDACPDCQLLYEGQVSSKAKEFSSSNFKLSQSEIENDFEKVMSKIGKSKKHSAKDTEVAPVTISVSGQVIELPRSMSFLKDQEISWKEFGKKNAIATIPGSLGNQLYLIYIGPGEGVPAHNHTGTEYSYVAAGSYNDGISDFNTGDFTLSTNQVAHSPKATSDDGCLVISWVDGRLNFFRGIFSPLNKILWWYLHRA